jgi:phosphoserine aminotransferase
MSAIEKINEEKAARLYRMIDSGDFYRGVARPEDRSIMNVSFCLPTEELDAKFLREAEAAGLYALKGHRNVGGVRASIYNPMPMAGVEKLIGFMRDFEKNNG